MGLKVLNRTHYSDISGRTCEAERLLVEAQGQVLDDPSTVNVALERELAIKCAELQADEESFHRQKSRASRINEGDGNSGFFHKYVKARNKRLTIDHLIDDTGQVILDVSQMGQMSVDFYRKLLGVPNPEVADLPVSYFESLLRTKLSQEDVVHLSKPVSREEVRAVFFSMAANLLGLTVTLMTFIKLTGR
ncbi:unnamed protein product [Linum trigynum]|uniref:Uncharacterized protein n=1 Tax=Linum trigynum TaxID=586398 RepID=A0AAV2FU07_9ROSI